MVSRSKKSEETSPPPKDNATDNAQELMRKYFESQFEPLDLPSKPANASDSEEYDDEDEEEGDDFSGSEEDDWDGMSEDEDSPQVEVIEHQDAQRTDDKMDKKAYKAFMVSSKRFQYLCPYFNVLQKGKVPSAIDAPNKAAKPPATEEEKEEDADNFKHDLALQRLLRESHLLEDASDLAPTGKNRLKALDLRMQSLGAKTSLYKQEKMPAAHRIGIKAKAVSRDTKRRAEAKENGIILEKPIKVTKSSSNNRRERGIGGSSIGKFSGGTLNLSKQDFNSMTSSRDRGRGGRGGRGRGRGGRGRGRGRS